MKQTFYFDTGVRTELHLLCKGQVIRGGTKQIPFRCEDVPEGATFKFACDNPNLPEAEKMIVREIESEGLCSRYAYFSK